MLGKFIAEDFIAIAGEMCRFPASNENTMLPKPYDSIVCLTIKFEVLHDYLPYPKLFVVYIVKLHLTEEEGNHH